MDWQQGPMSRPLKEWMVQIVFFVFLYLYARSTWIMFKTFEIMVIFHHNYKYHNNLSFSNAYESITKNKIKNNTYTLNCTRNHQLCNILYVIYLLNYHINLQCSTLRSVSLTRLWEEFFAALDPGQSLPVPGQPGKREGGRWLEPGLRIWAAAWPEGSNGANWPSCRKLKGE